MFRELKKFVILLLAGVCLALPAHAKRLALVLGNDQYTAVSKLQKAGNDASAMARELMTGMSHPTVRTTIDLFEAGGWANVRPTPRGRIRGVGRVLSAA
jgi:hypothetical protein